VARKPLEQSEMLLLSGRPSARCLAFISIGQVSLFAGFAVVTAAVVGGSGYVIREAHRQVAVVRSVAGLPTPPLVTPEMLQISSIALGRVPMAVINGVLVSEGAAIQLQTSGGIAILRVEKIKDGEVEFRYGREIFSVGLGATVHAR
jgi:hypothetical protein